MPHEKCDDEGKHVLLVKGTEGIWRGDCEGVTSETKERQEKDGTSRLK